MEKNNYFVTVHSVEQISGSLVDKILKEFYFESYFDAVEKFESLVGWYVFNGFLNGTFSNVTTDAEAFSCRRVILNNRYTTYYITIYDFKK